MQEEKQIDFDFNEILNQFRSGKRLTGKDGVKRSAKLGS